jgi:hypothetical protein
MLEDFLFGQILLNSDPRLAASEFLERGEIRELVVHDWKNVEKPIYLAVRSDKISRRLKVELLTRLKKKLAR